MTLLSILLNILLLTVDANASPVMDKLVDVGLSLAILGVVSKVLWGKIKELEARQTKYIDEDRKEMIGVIKENTEAFRSLKSHLEKSGK